MLQKKLLIIIGILFCSSWLMSMENLDSPSSEEELEDKRFFSFSILLESSSEEEEEEEEEKDDDFFNKLEFITDLKSHKELLRLIHIPSKNYLMYFLKGDYLPKCINLRHKTEAQYFIDRSNNKNEAVAQKSFFQKINEYFCPKEDFCTFWDKIKKDIICVGAHVNLEGKAEHFLYVCQNATLVVYDHEEKEFAIRTMINPQETKANDEAIVLACFNCNSKRCAFILKSNNKCIRIYNCRTNKCEPVINAKHNFSTLAFNNTGTCLVASASGDIIFFDLTTKKEGVCRKIFDDDTVIGTVFSPDDTMLFVVGTLQHGRSCQVAIYNVKKKVLQKLFNVRGWLEFIIWPKKFKVYAFVDLENDIRKIDFKDFIEDANPSDANLFKILQKKGFLDIKFRFKN